MALGRVLALVLVSALLLLSLLVLVFGLLGVIPGVLEVSSVTVRMWRSWVETECVGVGVGAGAGVGTDRELIRSRDARRHGG